MKLTRNTLEGVTFVEELTAGTVALQQAAGEPFSVTVSDTPPTRAVYSRAAVLVAADAQGLLDGLDDHERREIVDDVILELSGDLDPIITGYVPVTITKDPE